MREGSKTSSRTLRQTLSTMKGQAIPLFSYHLIRDYVLKDIAGEYQSSILYWAGKNLANQFKCQSVEDCMDVFLDLGWGNLEQNHASRHIYRFVLTSPYFHVREVHDSPSTFALECGFLTQSLENIEGKETEGEFSLQNDHKGLTVHFTIYVQAKSTSK